MSPFIHEVAALAQGRSFGDVIDVLLVAFILWRLLLIIRGTKAVQLLIGLAVLAGIGIVAGAFHLKLTSWIFRNLTPALLVSFVVLFQPELRRALDQVGRVRLSPLRHDRRELSVDAIAQALRALAESKTGALVAFEREVGLEEYVSTGIPLDAKASAEAIQAIFWPGNPLHDGAVIIRRGRIAAAACVLPLGETQGKRTGTRHKAAIGVSQESDALVAIVSEETGAISIAEDGKLRRVAADSLAQALIARIARDRVDKSAKEATYSKFLGVRLRRRKTDRVDDAPREG